MTHIARRGSAAAARADDRGVAAKLAVPGLIALGIVHLLVGWLALQLAWGGTGGESADSSGALSMLAGDTLGQALLWVLAAGLAMLTVWQALEAIGGHREVSGKRRIAERLGSAAKAVVYAGLAFSAARFAVGGGSSQSSKSSEESYTAKLMDAPAGAVLVGAIGLGIIAIGGYLAYSGISKHFARKLDSETRTGKSGDAAVTVGRIGYVAKGVAFAIAGGLVIAAAATHDAKKSGGLDDALRTLRDQPYGQWLLTAVAIGIAAYGVFCFFWARSEQRRS
jgi:hypothetical protein